MMRQIGILAVFLFWANFGFGQNAPLAEPNYDYPLLRLLKNESDRPNRKVHLLVKTKFGNLVSKPYVTVNSRFGNLSSIEISLGDIPLLLADNQIETISLGGGAEPLIDSVKYHTNAFSVHKGWGPLGRIVTGKNVIIGIVDSGVDFGHNEFRNPAQPDKTRILYAWNQWDSKGNHPDSFSYGSEYSQQQIQDELDGKTSGAVPHTDEDNSGQGATGHGTHCAGIAAGISGMAPQADIISVSILWENASVVDGVKYIIDKAIELDRPCVINLSLGDRYNIHDGTGLDAAFFNKLANIRPEGTIICAAAGNDGNKYVHWGNFEVTENPKYCYFYGDPVHMAMAIPDSIVSTLEFKIEGYKGEFNYEKNTWSNVAKFDETEWVTPSQFISDSTQLRFRYDFTGYAAYIDLFTEEKSADSKNYLFTFNIDDLADVDITKNPVNTKGVDLYKLLVRGTGSFQSWMQFSGSLSFMRGTYNAEEVGLYNDSLFVPTDYQYTVLAPGLYKETFCVGASVNKRSYRDVTGTVKPPAWNRFPNGSLAKFSSKGPTVDGRIQPEIVAPGQNVFSAIPAYYPGFSDLVWNGEYGVKSGTSMSTPCVAGAVALYLELHPKATIEDVRRDFLSNTAEDEWTDDFGQLPNNNWGHGKLDIYKVLNDGIPFEIPEMDDNAPLQIYPNPASNTIHFNQEIEEFSIFNTTGQLLFAGSNKPVLQVDISQLTPGPYLIALHKNGIIHHLLFIKD